MKKISKSKAFELLNNTKIFVGNPMISKKVQNTLFKTGFYWCNAKNEHKFIEEPFIFCEDGELTYESTYDINYFIEHENKEISAIEILSWEIVIDKPAFKPFQKVLIRDSNEDNWMCAFYSHYEKCTHPYIVSSGISAKYCIPYEGNESLLGTDKSPKEDK